MSTVERALAALAEAPALRGVGIEGVWLFGSFARGESTSSSDVDIAILCASPFDLGVATEQVSRLVDRDVDLIDLRRADAQLVWEILTTGRLLSENDELAIERFVREARWAAEDDEQRSRMALLAQVPNLEERWR